MNFKVYLYLIACFSAIYLSQDTISENEFLQRPAIVSRTFVGVIHSVTLGVLKAPEQTCCQQFPEFGKTCPVNCLANLVILCGNQVVFTTRQFTLEKQTNYLNASFSIGNQRCFDLGLANIEIRGSGNYVLQNFHIFFTKPNEINKQEQLFGTTKDTYVTIEYTTECNPFYGKHCSTWCIPINEKHVCLMDGTQQCRQGFSGNDCSVGSVYYCNPNKCRNNGECELIPGGGFVCKCTPAYTGVFCQSPKCNNFNCIHGRCDFTTGDCVCNEGFGGPNCENKLCRENSCNKQGVCTSGVGEFTCLCNAKYSGSQCEFKCNPECAEGTLCTILGDETLCACPPGTMGSNCSPLTLAAGETSYCKNGGKLMSQSGNPYSICKCPTGFTGRFCDVTTCDSSNCINGVCINSYDVCFCNNNYIGADCSIPSCGGSNSCKNQGTCLSVVNNIECRCRAGTTGAKCQYKCRENCGSFGTCIVENGVSKCECDGIHQGADCSEDITIKLCADFNCLNGGTCQVANRQPFCNCPNYWSGPRCELPACDKNSCVNGNCVENLGCQCFDLWIGSRCEIPFCSNRFCNGNGICRISNGVRSCDCNSISAGETCEFTCTANCGNGVCTILNNIMQCACDPFYSGETCEIFNNIQEEVNTIFIGFLVVLVIILLLVVVLLLAAFVFKRGRRSALFTKGTIQQGLNFKTKEDKTLDWTGLKYRN